MGKKRKTLTAELRAEWKARSERIERLLRERIASRESKSARGRAAGDP